MNDLTRKIFHKKIKKMFPLKNKTKNIKKKTWCDNAIFFLHHEENLGYWWYIFEYGLEKLGEKF